MASDEIQAAVYERTCAQLVERADVLWRELQELQLRSEPCCAREVVSAEAKVAELEQIRVELDAAVSRYEASAIGGSSRAAASGLATAATSSARQSTVAAAPSVQSPDLDDELTEPPPEMKNRSRRGACSAEAYGVWNVWRSAEMRKFPKTREQQVSLLLALQCCPLLKHLEAETLDDLVEAMEIVELTDGECIMKQGDSGTAGYVILKGDAEVWKEDGKSEREYVRTMVTGRLFGESAMMWSTPRGRSVYARGNVILAKLEREVHQMYVSHAAMEARERRRELLREVEVFETLGAEEMARIAGVVEDRTYSVGQKIVRQGDEGDELFIIFEGECVATVSTGSSEHADVQEVKRYSEGGVFGELAILERCRRKATVTASTQVKAMVVSRLKFERLFGSMDALAQKHYLSDPRKSIADFYRPGNRRGPYGVCSNAPNVEKPKVTRRDVRKSVQGMDFPGAMVHKSSSSAGRMARVQSNVETEWFAVYRPTSRDAIAKMLNGIAVGKGLNVKGKSAKKGHLSGFVPFLQISKNEHKKDIEASPPDSRLRVYYCTREARAQALAHLEPLLPEAAGLQIDGPRAINLVDDFPGVFGIDVPEPVLREAYIEQADITFMVGWETGRASEPAFMDMNLHAVRGHTPPTVVLYHIDTANPMNPHGLLIAYEEATVKPVVSDFDTFTVGSRNMEYMPPLPNNQRQLAMWALEHTEEILQTPGTSGWNSRWLKVLQERAQKGIPSPDLPAYGFGDATSYRLVGEIVKATSESGAVRHGAECFNFFFPQELDENYLVVWEGFMEDGGKPWDYMDEPQVRTFLLERAEEGYAFPLNPVWPVRDRGWSEVLESLLQSPACKAANDSWYGSDGKMLERINALQKAYPLGFRKDGAGPGTRLTQHTLGDLDACEKADIFLALALRAGTSPATHGKCKFQALTKKIINHTHHVAAGA
eukprot:TRINITY_DN4162_c0_g1_i1.p1 TRINITY_DN4162_c0_g1~~TRINITY_DN4162_c0_g1_i1.p1  ORF type:complete len:941 (+),score=242.83 TRINITY_DN4162_c0_g1_i1:112-2934(+)